MYFIHESGGKLKKQLELMDGTCSEKRFFPTLEMGIRGRFLGPVSKMSISVFLRSTPHPATVTNPTKHGIILVVTVTGWGVVPKYFHH